MANAPTPLPPATPLDGSQAKLLGELGQTALTLGFNQIAQIRSEGFKLIALVAFTGVLGLLAYVILVTAWVLRGAQGPTGQPLDYGALPLPMPFAVAALFLWFCLVIVVGFYHQRQGQRPLHDKQSEARRARWSEVRGDVDRHVARLRLEVKTLRAAVETLPQAGNFGKTRAYLEVRLRVLSGAVTRLENRLVEHDPS